MTMESDEGDGGSDSSSIDKRSGLPIGFVLMTLPSKAVRAVAKVTFTCRDVFFLSAMSFADLRMGHSFIQ
jgi:hypothetical protein